jgi:hypothetical protein
LFKRVSTSFWGSWEEVRSTLSNLRIGQVSVETWLRRASPKHSITPSLASQGSQGLHSSSTFSNRSMEPPFNPSLVILFPGTTPLKEVFFFTTHPLMNYFFFNPADVQLSPYRIIRVVDRAGAIHVVRKEAKTEFQCSRQGYFTHPSGCNR